MRLRTQSKADILYGSFPGEKSPIAIGSILTSSSRREDGWYFVPKSLILCDVSTLSTVNCLRRTRS